MEIISGIRFFCIERIIDIKKTNTNRNIRIPVRTNGDCRKRFLMILFIVFGSVLKVKEWKNQKKCQRILLSFQV